MNLNSNSTASTSTIIQENNKNRYWPVDPRNQYNTKHRPKRTQYDRRYKSHHVQRGFHRNMYIRAPHATRSGNL